MIALFLISPLKIDGMGHSFKMIGIDTSAITTQVIYLHPLWDLTFVLFVIISMCPLLLPASSCLPISITVSRQLPFPTTRIRVHKIINRRLSVTVSVDKSCWLANHLTIGCRCGEWRAFAAPTLAKARWVHSVPMLAPRMPTNERDMLSGNKAPLWPRYLHNWRNVSASTSAQPVNSAHCLGLARSLRSLATLAQTRTGVLRTSAFWARGICPNIPRRVCISETRSTKIGIWMFSISAGWTFGKFGVFPRLVAMCKAFTADCCVWILGASALRAHGISSNLRGHSDRLLYRLIWMTCQRMLLSSRWLLLVLIIAGEVYH